MDPLCQNYQCYALYGGSLIPKMFIVELYIVYPLCQFFLNYALHGVSLVPKIFIVMRYVVDPHGQFIYIYTGTLCLHMPNISFPDFRVPPKKRKPRDISNKTKCVARLYLEEHWSFVDEQLTSDFILTHGHI